MYHPFEDNRIKAERGRDPERDLVENLFNQLAEKYGRGAVLKYIEDHTEVAQNVVKRWLNKMERPSSGICKAILAYLQNFQPGDLPELKKILRPPLKPKPAAKSPVAEKKLSPQEQRRQDTIKSNEEQLNALMKKLKDEGKIL